MDDLARRFGTGAGRKRLRGADLTRLEFGCACLAVFLAPFTTLRFGGVLFTASDLLVCLSLFLLLASGRFPLSPLGRATPLWLLGSGLIVLGLTVSSLHGSPTRALIVNLQYFFAYVVQLFVLVRNDRLEMHRLAGLFVAGMVLADIYSLAVFYAVGYQPGSLMVSGAHRLSGFFGTANLNAAMNALALPLLLYLWLNGSAPLLLLLPALAVIGTTIVHTGSNSGFLAACVGLVVFLAGVMSWRLVWRGFLVGGAAVVAFRFGGGTELLPKTFQDRVLGALSSGDLSQAGTLDHRLALMREALEVITDRGILLVGIGADQFRAISLYEVSVHNMYLLLWVEGGVLALLGWVLFSAIIVMLGLAARRQGIDRPAGAAATAIVAMFVLIGVSNPHMYARYWTMPIQLSLGLVMLALRGRAVSAIGGPVAKRETVRWLGRAATGAVLLGLSNASVAAAGVNGAGFLSAADVRATLRHATEFMRERATARGSYGWWYTPDLAERHGEGRMTPTQGWVQPPGMPAVGTAYLQAYEATGDPYYLDSAREVGSMLLRTQLRSGGWWYMAEFDPAARQSWCYRLERDCRGDAKAEENGFRDASTFDDNTTQGALAFLIRLDRVLPAPDPGLRDGIEYGLAKLVDAQYPNGAWPFRLDRRSSDPPPAGRRAKYPDEWSRYYVPIRSRLFYSTNDHLMRNGMRLFLLAHKVYGEQRYVRTALRAGEFLLAAQLPEPQPGWAQQYNEEMEPIWGRKFEPPAIASRETAGNVDALLELYLYTGEQRWLEAAASAAGWLERSRLPDGEWPRFYELQSNRPLYMTSTYELTYSDADTPRHYGFKNQLDIPEAIARYRDVTDAGGEHCLAVPGNAASDEVCEARLVSEVAESVVRLDSEGRWVEGDRIYSETFIHRVEALAGYLAADDGRVLITGNPSLELAVTTDGGSAAAGARLHR